ncbi:hypothetical protein MJH12_16830 [bacterium]|nr:hypothetical protein [bacterium]
MIKIIISLLFLSNQLSWANSSIGIFLPENIQGKKSLKKGLKKEKLFKGRNLKVFASYKSLKLAAFKGKSPDIIIAPSLYFSLSTGYSPKLQFKLDSNHKGKYLLCSIDTKWSLSNTNSGVVGIIENIGRKGMKNFVKKSFKGNKFKSTQFSKSLKSLISSLGLDNTNYIILSEKNLSKLKKTFGESVQVLASSQEVNYPMIGAKTDVSDAEITSFINLSKSTLKLLDMDQIESCKGECK